MQQQVVRTQYPQQQILLNQPSPQNQPQRAQINQHLWAQQPGQQIMRHPVNIVQQGVPRMQWSPNQGNTVTVPQRHFIQLDAKTHNELQKMPPDQQALFVAKLQRQRQLIKQVQQRGGGSHILIRGEYYLLYYTLRTQYGFSSLHLLGHPAIGHELLVIWLIYILSKLFLD